MAIGIFDFANKDYVIGDDSALLAQEKALGNGKTAITIQRLLQLKKADEIESLEKLYELTQFIKSLSKHVAITIHKRCRFSWLRVPICSVYGPLNELSSLQHFFSSKLAKQKKVLSATLATHIQKNQADVPHLLHSLFTIDPTAKTGVAKVDALYQLIQKDGLFAPQESIQLAWYLANNPSIGPRVKKNALLGLPRTLFSDSEGRVFICQKGNKTKRVVVTGVKSISKALMLQNLKQATVVAQATTLDILSAETRGSVCREYHIAQELQGHPGIWRVHHGDKYIKEKNNKKKFTYFSDFAICNFSVPAKAKTLSLEALIKVTKTLLNALTYIHSKGYLHVDLKCDNILMKDTLDDAGIIDFGLSGKIDDERVIEFFKCGRYGTRKYSAPELFGVKNFGSGEDYEKTDVWGLGLTLLRARLANDPTWFKFIPPKGNAIEYEHKEAYKNAIIEQIDVPLKALLQKKNPTKEEQLDIVIYQMVQSNPDTRLSAKDALTLALKL
ncbi:MAG: protein kinase [Chlamydiales bacterium]|nr:protein kinase [Chlamydiales bacterium]